MKYKPCMWRCYL